MAGPDSWMPVYWADLWNKTRHLNAVEQCAYYNLLGSMWVEGGSLPNDNDRLQRMSRVTEKEWRAVKASVTAYFDRGEDGRLYQKRLSEEYAKSMKAYTARSEHMRTVNERRNENRKQSPSAVTVDDASHTDSHVTHNSQSPNGELAAKPPKPRGQKIPGDWQPSAADIEFATERGVSAARVPSIAQHFRDHHTAKGTVTKDVSASWRTWIANDLRFHGPDKAPGGTAPKITRSDADWLPIIERYQQTKTWPASGWGPEPGYGGCEVPARLIEQFNLDGLGIPNLRRGAA
jgi:uncharacterized protein YdaU (DUF1376 family)